MIKLGDTVTVMGTYQREVDKNRAVKWVEYACPCRPGIFVGWSWVQEGTIHPWQYVSGYGEEDGSDIEAHLAITNTVKVAMVQPLGKGQRYRKPKPCHIVDTSD